LFKFQDSSHKYLTLWSLFLFKPKLFRRDNRLLCKFLTSNKNEALIGANAITHLVSQEEQTDSETTNSAKKTTGKAISPLTQATFSTNHQPIKGFQGVPAKNFNRDDQVNELRAPLYFNQVNQSLYHATIAPQSWVNRNLPQSLLFYLSILNNNIRHEKNVTIEDVTCTTYCSSKVVNHGLGGNRFSTLFALNKVSNFETILEVDIIECSCLISKLFQIANRKICRIPGLYAESQM